MNNFKYSVWVGGSEVNDHYLTLQQAVELKAQYIELGYDDVEVEKISN